MLHNLTLEVSLKPFKDLSDNGIREICETIYKQWYALISKTEQISILLWSADGSEILDYKGCMSDTFEWAKYIGNANPKLHNGVIKSDCIANCPRLYMEQPAEFRYGDLKRIINIVKKTFGQENKQVRAGATFDPGPEFAVSSFKYKRHPEILLATTLGMGFTCCYAELNEDSEAYAGFPDGIRQETSLGTFLGRQTKLFCRDLGFDYIWFSNGFGFGSEPWWVYGPVFDGENFSSEQCEDIKRKIFAFWTDFRHECPDLPVETRGTNLSTAMDLASDGVPLREIYNDIPDISPPPNPPCASLRNNDYGIELIGWMSHIAELPPGKGYPFRYYIHDPWWQNSPWLDRYGCNPHDIYLPMSLTRINAAGIPTSPESINLLTVDDSSGNMPNKVPNEVIPHLFAAIDTSPDEPGPFIWLYPFDEYHDKTFAGSGIDEVFFGDWFMRNAVNTGFPLNTVISTANFVAAPENCAAPSNIIVAPAVVAENVAVLGILEKFLLNGGKVLFYGPTGARLRQLLQLEACVPVSGELQLNIGGNMENIFHNEIYSAGGITEKAINGKTRVIASVNNGKESRDYAVIREFSGGGGAAWIRGSNSFTIPARYPQMLDRQSYYYPEELMRVLAEEFGWNIHFEKYDTSQTDPVLVIKKHANARYLAAYVPNMNTTEYLGFPEGAPVFTETETIVSGSQSKYTLSKATHLECRVFLEMDEGAVQLKETISLMPGVKRRLMISGLKNAIVRFRPESGYENTTKALLDPDNLFITGTTLEPCCTDLFGGLVLEYKDVTGKLLISW